MKKFIAFFALLLLCCNCTHTHRLKEPPSDKRIVQLNKALQNKPVEIILRAYPVPFPADNVRVDSSLLIYRKKNSGEWARSPLQNVLQITIIDMRQGAEDGLFLGIGGGLLLMTGALLTIEKQVEPYAVDEEGISRFLIATGIGIGIAIAAPGIGASVKSKIVYRFEQKK